MQSDINLRADLCVTLGYCRYHLQVTSPFAGLITWRLIAFGPMFGEFMLQSVLDTLFG